MDKKLIFKLLIMIGVIVGLILLISLFKNLSKHTAFNYSNVRYSLQEAAIRYAEDHQNKLPQTGKEYLELSDDLLVSEGYFKGYDKLYDDEIICNGYVNVFREGENAYTYITSLNCNDKKRDTIYERVLEDNKNGVTEETGLYAFYKGQFITNKSKLNDPNITSKASYVFRGDESKELYNYIQFENMLWRILEIDENGDLILMYDSSFSKPYSWDFTYNGEYEDYSGVNDYYKNGIKSNIADVLGTFYYGGITLQGGQNNQPYSHIIQMISLPMDLCVGKRSESDEGYDGSIECSEKVKEQNVGILPAYMFMRASLDENCTTMSSPYCSNHNYLANYNQSYWLITASSEESNMCLYVNETIGSQKCKSKFAIKPIIKIPGDLEVREDTDGGIGSRFKPYRIYSFYKKTVEIEE